MKSSTLFSIISILFIGKALSSCFSEELGYPCCKDDNATIIYTDSSGNWGSENDDWCGISNKASTSASCWSLSYNYPCCESTTEVFIIDKYGKWGVEHGNWCGLPQDTPYESDPDKCWSLIYGYPCCSNKNAPVVTSDSFGSWGVENDDWCGVTSNNNSSETHCWTEKLGFPCCKSNVDQSYIDDTGRWGFENGYDCGISEILPSWTEPTNLPPLDGSALVAKQYMDKLNPLVNPLNVDVNYTADGVNVEKVEFFSKFSQDYHQLNIVFPPNYSVDKKYPVLYLLHGVDANEDSLIMEENGVRSIPAELAKQKKAKEMIIVSPRVNVYPPGVEEPPVEFNTEYLCGFDNFIYELTESIMPFIEDNYPILTGRENTAIAGFSMGGRTAIYIGYSLPDKFGYVCGLSPAFGLTPISNSPVYPGLFPSNEDVKIKDVDNTPLVTLISWGNEDIIVNPYPELYHRILSDNNQPHISMEVDGANHDSKAISTGFYNFVLTLFGQLDE